MFEHKLHADCPSVPGNRGEPSFPADKAHGWAEYNPFYDDALLHPAIAHLDGGQVHCVEVHDADGLLTARLPMVQSRRHGRFPVPHVANWVHAHCFYGAPLLRAGQEEAGWAALLARLDADPATGDFLHLRRIDPDAAAARALIALCHAQGRPVVEIERHERALLASTLDSRSYWDTSVRSKKRKELRRLRNRLDECGTIEHKVLTDRADLPQWCTDFLTLEDKGWKGEAGTALASRAADRSFFLDATTALFDRGALDMLRLDCSGKAIAMLVNFTGTHGGYSFKIAIDPEFGRYSPGTLIEIDNLARVLDDHVAPWMDSCAAPDHPMIDSLWGQRRSIVQYRIALRHDGLRGIRGRINRFGIGRAERLARGLKNRDAT